MSARLALQSLCTPGFADVEPALGDVCGLARGASAAMCHCWRVGVPRGELVIYFFSQRAVASIVSAIHGPRVHVSVNTGFPHLPSGRDCLATKAKIFANGSKPVAVELENAPRELQRVDCFDGRCWGKTVRDKPGAAFAIVETVYVVAD